jgi:RHS repeat-associated protein
VGKISDLASVTWQAPSAAPVVLRSLPAEAGVLCGSIRFEVDAQSGGGRGTVQWQLIGPAANLTIGTASGRPSTVVPLNWSAELLWDSTSVPDGMYTVMAVVTSSNGQQVKVSTVYRIQNAAAPIAPVNLTATAQAGGVALTWQQAASATSTTYRLFRDQPISGTSLAQISADRRSFVDAGVQAGSHRYQIVLADAQGRASQPATAEVVVAAPANVRPEAVPDLQVLLPTGQALAPGGRVTDRILLIAPAMGGLRFQISSDGRSWAALQQSPTCARDVCTLDLRMEGQATGPYSVRAINPQGTSPTHSFVRTEPTRYGPPTAVSAELTGLGVQLSWKAPAAAIPASYHVARRVHGGDWELLDQVAATSFIDARALAGRTSDYRISAVDPEGQVGTESSPVTVSLASNELAELQASGSLAAPVIVGVTASHGRAAVRWEPVSGSNGYLVERQLELGGAFAAAGRTGASSFVDSPILAAREVSYRVISVAGAVESSASAVVTILVVPSAAPAPVVEPAPLASRPAAPSALTAATRAGEVQLTWSPGASSELLTYNVYRVDPNSGAFGLAASGVATPSFTDTALPSARFEYAVTASSAGGMESVFSEPVWVNVAAGTPTLNIELIAPTPAESSLIQSESLQALARVTAAAGLDLVSFAIAPAGGLWRELSAVPIDPHRPLPGPTTSAPAALWGTFLNATSMAAGSYKLRVQARDRAGHSQEQVKDLYFAGPAARGPPSFALNTTTTPGGVHLQWSSANSGGFLVQRSVFGPQGPFESLSTTRAQQYDDLLAIPGHSYAYQVVQLGSTLAASTVVTATPRIGQSASLDDGPSIALGAFSAVATVTASAVRAGVDGPTVALGAVSSSELAVYAEAVSQSHPLDSELRALTSVFDVNAISLATGSQVHLLGEPSRVTFRLPASAAALTGAAIGIYHWDEAGGGWVAEGSTVDPSMATVTATINHLSEFVVASALKPAGAGIVAQPPAPPTDFNGSRLDRSLPTPPSVKPLDVAADGEVVSLRQANSRVYRTADGKLQQTISAASINYLDATGAWQKIDNNLVANGAGASGVHNAANSFHVDLPGAVNERAISIQVGSSTVSMSLVGATGAQLAYGGNQATYAGALAGADATYEVFASGLKESIVIKAKPAGAVAFTFALNSGSLVLMRQADGTVTAVDAVGQTRLMIAAPWMHDAAFTQSDHGTISHQVGVTLTGGSGSYVLTYTLDSAWLNNAARRYPVTLDPTITAYAGNGTEYDDQINLCSPDFNYHGYNYLPIGYTYFDNPCYASYPSRALVQFTNFLGDGYYATSATFYLYQYTNYGYQRGNCCQPYYLVAPTSAWSYTGVTWRSQPPGYTGVYSTAYELNSAGWVSWDATSLVRAWQTHGLANNGVMVYNPNENGPYNTNEMFYGGVSGTSPQLTINYDYYWYTIGASVPSKLPSGGTAPIEVALTNQGSVAWGTDTKLSYRWWSGGTLRTNYSSYINMPYSVPAGSTVDLRFNVSVPSLPVPSTVQLQFGMSNSTFSFSQIAWGSPNYACDQFYINPATNNCSSGTSITLASESGTIAWQGSPQVVSAVAGSLITLPLTLTNASTAAGANYTWRAYNHSDLTRVGVRDYRSSAGNVTPLSGTNLKTYLSADVAPQGTTNLNAVLQAPSDPGDYLLRVDLVHDTPGSTVWFTDQGNSPLEVRARIVAPGDDKTTNVPVPLGDGSSLGVNTSNGFAALSTTDIHIAERGNASLEVSRTYHGVNGLLSTTGTSATSAVYGLGWTFNFQRSLHLGSLGPNTYDPATGTLTDAQGRAWTLTWNYARGSYEDAAGNRTVTPTSVQVTTAGNPITVPGLRPVDLLNGTSAVTADASAPGGYALRLEGTTAPPTALVMPSGLVPVQQNGTIEFWFRPNFDMSTDTGCHVFFSDGQMRFGLAWNCTTPTWGSSVARAIEFFTYDADTSTYNVLPSAAVTWANGSWHHISITWTEGGAKQMMTDLTVVSNASHAQSPVGDLVFGYEADGNGSSLNFLNGRITQLRIDGRIVPQAELNTDAAAGATVNPTGNTLYLGRYDQGSAQSSAGTYVIRNADQSTETYSPNGVLLNQADRFGNQIDYGFDSSGRVAAISDHSIAGRSITFTYGANSFTATDLGNRTVTYQLNGSGDLVSVTKSNQIPDPRTGVVTNQNAITAYTYGSGHLLQQVADPRGARTRVNYDQSYRQVVLIDNPVAYWRLGETSGTTAQDATGSYPAALHGGITLAQGGALWGDADLAYRFDGTSAYLSTSAALSGISNSLTFEAWVNHGGIAWATGAHEFVIALRLGAPTYLSVYSGTIFMSVYDGTTQRTVQGGAVPAWGWHHLAGTWDGSQLRVYVDGVLSATSAPYTEGALTAVGNTSIGGYDGVSYFFKGTLDEPAVYSSVLSAARVQAHFISGRLGVGANPAGYAAQVAFDTPAAYWRLGDTLGTTALDQSGSAANATYAGGYQLSQSGAIPSPDSAVSLAGSGYMLTGNLLSLVPGPSVTIESWFNARGPGVLITELGSAQINSPLWHDSQIELVDVGGGLAEARVRVWSLSALALGRVPYNSWHHVVLRYNSVGQVLDGFLDGILSTTTVTGARSVPAALYYGIGATDSTNMGSGAYFNGLVNEVAVYPLALANARIVAHYQAGKSAPLGGSPYASAVQAEFPVGYWRLGETSGTTALDSSGAARNGTYIGGITQGLGGPLLNDPAYATRFNGTNAYVSLGNSVALQLGTGAVEAWITTTTTVQSAIVAKPNAWWFGLQANGRLSFYDPTAAVMRDSGVAVNDGRWHHVAAVFQSGVAGGSQMFIDGRAAGSPFQMTVVNQTVELEIAGYGGSQLMNGTVEDVSLYSALLSPARILAHYQASRFGWPAATGGDLSTYTANVSADRPVGYWRLGEPSGQATDSSGNAHPTTVANAITYGVAGAIAGDSDTAMGFNGTSSYLSIPYTASLAPSTAVSLEIWMKTGANPGVIAVLLDTENSACSKGAKLNFDSTGHAQFQIDPLLVLTSGVLGLNAWHHVVGTYDGTYQRLYVDGSLVAGPTPATYVANDGGNITIGALTNVTTNFWNGSLDEPAIYNYALSPARVMAHFMAASDFSQRRVYSVQDAKGATIASLAYNDDAATTQVIDARGLPAYYTFQQYGGRTLSVTDTGNNLTRYEYDGGAAYRLMATVSPTGIRQSRFMNSGAPVGQQSQTLMSDSSSQPSTVSQTLMYGTYADVYTYGTTTLASTPSDSWTWDSTVTVLPGVASHRSTPGVIGSHHHDVTFSTGVLIPAGSQLIQWVYVEPAAHLPGNIALQLTATDATSRRAWWGAFGLLGSGQCPTNCNAGGLPTAGRWVALTVPLGPAEGASPQVDVDLANHLLNAIQFTEFGGTGAVWWGPTILQFPSPSVTDPTRAVSRYSFNATNDQVASVDPNGIAAISDVDASGLTRASSTGVAPAPVNLLQDNVNALGTSAWQQEFGYGGTSAQAVTTPQHGTIGSLIQQHTGAGLQSDLYKDVTGLSPGTYILVSVWAQTDAAATGTGGASLAVDNRATAPNLVVRRSASFQTAGQWAQLTLPFIVDGSGQIRLRLWHENLQGKTYWADLRVDDITPAPDVTLQHPLAVYTSSFEIQPDTSWSLGSTPATALNDATQARTGLYSIKDTLAASTTTNTVSRTVAGLASATYRVTAWARTVASGGGGGTGGGQLCAQFSGSNCFTGILNTEGQWQQQQIQVSGSGTLTIQLTHVNFRGDVFWDDVNVERVADQTPATSGSWRGTAWTGALNVGASATWASSWTGGVGGGPSRQITVTAAGATNDITDTLTTQALRTNATYNFSLWASSSMATSITVSGAGLNVTCPSLQATPTVCQSFFTYTGGDRTTASIVIAYGGQGVRTVNISRPLLALQSDQYDYTAYGQVSRTRDIFGRSNATTYDVNSLYPSQTVVTATPSPNQTTIDVYNPLGQLIEQTKGGTPGVATQTWVDSWGRQVGVVKNCANGVAPPNLCTGTADASTNVMTRFAYDLNGNLVDQYEQGQLSGTWIDTHYVYDANNKRLAEIKNCVFNGNPCDPSSTADATSSASQNVVTAYAYDVLNSQVDMYAPLPGCISTCMPIPTCTAGPPLVCSAPATPCLATTCIDTHWIYDLANRVSRVIVNYNGSGDASQANVTTSYAYDADGRVIDVLTPITNATLQTGQIDQHKVYDGLGRLVTDINANVLPSWMAATTPTTPSRIDYTLDAGGRTAAVTAPGTGSVAASNRVVTTTDYSDLGRPLKVVADANGVQATTRIVYDTSNLAIHTWTPPTQALPGGRQTTTVYDLGGQAVSSVNDDGVGGLQLTTKTTFDAFGRATDVIDPRGIDTNTTYDALNRPSSMTKNYCPSGTTNPNCSGSGITPDQNVATSYVYDLAGNHIEVINPRGTIEFTAYDALHRATYVTQGCTAVPAPGGTTCGTQSSDQNVLSSKTYDQTGAVMTATDPLIRVNVFAYDALGRKVQETFNCVGANCTGGQTSGQNLVTKWQVDAQANVLLQQSPRSCTATAPCYQGATGATVTEGNPLATAYSYDGLLRLQSVTEDQSGLSGHLNLVTSYAYDPSGNKLAATDGRGFTTTYTVDNLGRVTSAKDALNNIVQTSYSPAGEVTQTINARGKTDVNTLDRVSRLVGVSYLRADNTTAAVRSFGYDADGNKSCFSDATGCTGNPTTITYDHLNRVSTVTSPAPLGTTTYAYFLDGPQQSVTDAIGTTTYTEDRLGRVASMVDPLNGPGNSPTTYTYDATGRLTSRAESGPVPVSSWTLLQSQNVAHVLSPTVTLTTPTTAGNALVIAFTGNDGSNTMPNTPSVTSISDNGAVHANFVKAVSATGSMFDDAEIWYASNIPAGITSLTLNVYWPAPPTIYAFTTVWAGEYSGLATTGMLDQVAGRANANTMTHPTGTTAPTSAPNELVLAVYEDWGYNTPVTPPTGWNVRFNTSPAWQDQQVTVDQNGASTGSYSAIFTTTVALNSIGAIATFKPAGGGGPTSNVVTTASYTAADQIASKTEVSGTTTLASSTNVAYDFAQNRTAETLTYYAGNPYPDPQAGTSTYLYDTVNQLSQGNLPGRTAANYGYDNAHNLTSNAGVAQTYNNNESLQTACGVTIGLPDADGNQLKDCSGNALSWDSLSQLEKFSTTETYVYDAMSRLVKVTNGANVTQFVYRGLSNQVVAELDGTGAVIRSYAWDSKGRQLYTKIGSSVYYEITNLHGDVVALATTTALAGTLHFDPWGNRLGAAGTTIPFGFQGSAGSWTDATTSFVSMGARWYYPKDSLFLSGDPAAGTANPRTPMAGLRWLYALDNPLAYSDPSGLRILIDDGGDYTVSAKPSGSTTYTPSSTYSPPAQPKPPAPCDFWCHAKNGWNAATQIVNIRPDAGGVQDNLIALGNHMDSGWKQRYRDTLASSADWVNGTRSDLVSGDPYRIARGTAGVVVFSSNFVPVGGVFTAGRTLVMRGGAALLERAPQLVNVAREALTVGREALTQVGSRITAAFERWGAGEVTSAATSIARSLPSQIHHFATNKSTAYTARVEAIASRYGLSLDEAWNKELLPHLGRHPNQYHEFVLDGMRQAAREAGADRDAFLGLFEQYVKDPVRQNPELLRKSGWV